mmetsp:Transcript_45399/g.82989  ORF Transcript_45399/g.82989 Transcript_45399/m.82989 type:complete len:173 (-) Transcript_45399:141-659(-)
MAAGSKPSDRDTCLAAVKEDWDALQHASEVHRSDREIVLAAVSKNGCALQHAGESCRNDPEIALAAVKTDAYSIAYVGHTCINNPEIVLAAVAEESALLQFAGDELLDDSNFAVKARRLCYILKVVLLSGRYTNCVVYFPWNPTDTTSWVIQRACVRPRFALPRRRDASDRS